MQIGSSLFLLAAGAILAFAVQDSINGVDLTMVGWIMTVVGIVILALSAITNNRARGARSMSTTTHADGTQSVSERRTDV